MTAITTAGPAHAEALAALHAAAGFEPGWSETAIAGLLAVPGTFALAHGAEGALLARVAADEAELLTLAVVPASRRRGIARALLQAAMTAARRGGAAAMFLEVAETNGAARALYRAAGFAELGMRRDYYRPGGSALLLRAILTDPGGSAVP